MSPTTTKAKFVIHDIIKLTWLELELNTFFTKENHGFTIILYGKWHHENKTLNQKNINGLKPIAILN